MRSDFKNLLKECGLSDTSARVFLAALERGPASASVIAKQAGMNRVTAYEALKRLSAEGFIKIRAKRGGGVKYFEAQSIDVLKHALEAQKSRIEGVIAKFEGMQAQINSLYQGVHEKPLVHVYEGREGLQALILDTFAQKPNEILSFCASVEMIQQTYDMEFLSWYWAKRTSLKILARGILLKTPENMAFFNEEKNRKELRQTKFISPGEYPDLFHGLIETYGNSVAITSMERGEPHGLIIRSKSIAQSFRLLYELIWRMI
jgi:sugar-specific transcriptional regulator TrmB